MFRIATVLCLSLLFMSGFSYGKPQNWKSALYGSYRLELKENQVVGFDITENLEVLVWRWNEEDVRTLSNVDVFLKAGSPEFIYDVSFTLVKSDKEKVDLSILVIENNVEQTLKLMQGATASHAENGTRDILEHSKLSKRVHRSGLHETLPKAE